jgi:hypothetical protein
MATFTDAAQRKLDREFERQEARRDKRHYIAPPNECAEVAETFQFPGDGLALFHPRYGLRLTQEDAKPWVQMDARTAERFADWLLGQVRAAEDHRVGEDLIEGMENAVRSVRAGRLDVV